MTIGYWCILAAAFLPYFFVSFAKFSGPGFNNYKPRVAAEKLEGARQRAHWAQLNSFESFPMFASAMIIAHLAQGKQSSIDTIGMIYVASRVLYGIFYIANKAPLRSISWFIGIGCIVALFIAPQLEPTATKTGALQDSSGGAELEAPIVRRF